MVYHQSVGVYGCRWAFQTGGDFTAHIRGERFKSRYDVTAGLRLRIPSTYRSLFHEELATETREVRLMMWVGDTLHIQYRPDERLVLTPRAAAPRYNYHAYCSTCRAAYSGDLARCPECNKTLRRRPRRNSRKSGGGYSVIEVPA
ncbi:MAG: hypothetical protein QXM16_01560 [Nitrososphaerota archaeon]